MNGPQTFRNLIQHWPSIPDFARDLNVPVDRVYGWHRRNSIPSAYWTAVQEAAAKYELDIAPGDFLHFAANRSRNGSK